MSKQVIMAEIPQCNFCDKPAKYDGKTKMGPWAYMCQQHWESHGIGMLGTGLGQELIQRKEN